MKTPNRIKAATQRAEQSKRETEESKRIVERIMAKKNIKPLK